MVRMKAASIAVVACLSAAGLTACSVYESAPKRSCSPSYVAPSKYGNYSAQQAGPGRSIQWGIYPNFAASHYTVNVFMGSRRVDDKDQSYPPHGSVNAVDVRPPCRLHRLGDNHAGPGSRVFRSDLHHGIGDNHRHGLVAERPRR
jgi:hypothetical protein